MSAIVSYFAWHRYAHDEDLDLFLDDDGICEWDWWMREYSAQTPRHTFSSVRVWR